MATIKEVARRAGVSHGTVYNVMSGAAEVSPDLRKRVEKASRELGYRPNHIARSLKTRHSQMLGMVISDITNPFFPEMVRGAEEAALARGYVLTIFNTDDRIEREHRVFDILRSRQTDGLLVVVALPRGGHGHLRELLEEGTRIVCLDRIPHGFAVDAVTVDNEGGVRSAIDHLVAEGHTRIGYIGGRADQLVAGERLAGYLAGLSAAAIHPVKEWIKEGDFRPDSGYALAMELLSRRSRHPSALFVANILMTTGVLRALEELGLETPRDLALATFDRIALMDSFRPHLTSVMQPSYEIGRRGAELLMDRIEGKVKDQVPVRVKLDTTLVIRQSTVGEFSDKVPKAG